MKLNRSIFLAFLVVSGVLQVFGVCDPEECNHNCKSLGNTLGRCKTDYLCDCTVFKEKCNYNECDTGCRSRGNTLGRCKGDNLCQCILVRQ